MDLQVRIILKDVSVIINILIYENARASNQYPFLFFIINIAKQINKAATSVDVHKYTIIYNAKYIK